MGSCPVAVRRGPGNFRLEQGNPFGKVVDRKMVERFRRQFAGQIAGRAGMITNIHYIAQCGAFVLAVNRSRG